MRENFCQTFIVADEKLKKKRTNLIKILQEDKETLHSSNNSFPFIVNWENDFTPSPYKT